MLSSLKSSTPIASNGFNIGGRFAKRLNPRIVRELEELDPPWGPCGYVVYKRTYARMIKALGRTEDWHETVERSCNGILEIGGRFRNDEIEKLAYYWYMLKGTMAGRPMWQLGTDTVRRVGGDSLQNCFAGETEVLTSEGVFPVCELVGRPVKVYVDTGKGMEWIETIFSSYGQQDLMKITFADGSTVRATSDHQWIKYQNGKSDLDQFNRIPTKNLMAHKRLQLPLNFPELPEKDKKFWEGYAHGFTYGDGVAIEGSCRVELFGPKIQMLELLSGYGKHVTWHRDGIGFPVIKELPANWKMLPKNPTRSYALGFILGLGSADGHVRIDFRIHNKSEAEITQIQRLARYAGLRCHNPYLDREISPFDGTEKPLWCVGISTHNLTADYFIRDDQAGNFKASRKPQSIQPISVEWTGQTEEVFCCTVPVYHNLTLANGVQTGQCWYVTINEPVEPFCFAFNELMMGGGVGFGILPESIYELPPVRYRVTIERTDSFDCDYIVTDNREGWVELLRRVLIAFFYSGGNLRYNTLCVRDKGRPIEGFGGVASGPEELVYGIGLIASILTSAIGRKLRPTECMYIMNIIGMIVVAGNVRRSAEITIGSYQDIEYLQAKNWAIKNIPSWTQMSNNTTQCPDLALLPECFWDGYEGRGEPYGLFNLDAARHYGRLSDGYDYRPDWLVEGVNPCGEITLESYESCNLSEIFLPNIVDVSEFADVAGLLFKANKAVSCLPCCHPRTNAVVERNHRIGIGITGFLQGRHLHDADILDAVYSHLETVDEYISRDMGVNKSIKLTTVKPSGTVSLLAGVTPGVHAAYAPYYIRRITFAANDPLVEVARQHGHHVEPKINIDGSRDFNTMVVDFPHETPDGTQCAEGYSAIQQLENQRFLQTYWSDNAVSMTCYFRPHEIPAIKNWMAENYPHNVKTASFLLHKEHGFVQAPYEQITEDQYLELVGKITPINNVVDHKLYELVDSQECSGAGCPIK